MISQKGFTIWLTGLSIDTTSELAELLEGELLERGLKVELLDEQTDVIQDNITNQFNNCTQSCNSNAKKLGYIARLLTRNEVITIINAIAPSATIRNEQRSILENFIEVHIKSSTDPESPVYKDYEIPEKPEVVLDKDIEDINKMLKMILRTLEVLQWIPEGYAIDYSPDEESQIQDRLESLGYL